MIEDLQIAVVANAAVELGLWVMSQAGFHDHDRALFVSGITAWVSMGSGFPWL